MHSGQYADRHNFFDVIIYCDGSCFWEIMKNTTTFSFYRIFQNCVINNLCNSLLTLHSNVFVCVWCRKWRVKMGRKVVLATCALNQWAMDFDGNLKRILKSKFVCGRCVVRLCFHYMMLCISAAFTIVWCLSVPNSVRASVHHCYVFCWNEETYSQTFFTLDSHTILVFLY